MRHRLFRRRLLAVLVAAALLTGAAWSATAVGAGANGRGAFTDDDGSVHEANINGLAASGVTRGCNPPANTYYCPDRAVTRAEMATFLTRALDLPPAQTSTFTDTASSVHAANIAAIAQAGITKGCNPPQNTHYCPDRAVTRAEMATFLTRAMPDIEPILNRLSVRSGPKCTKDGTSCTGRLTLAAGIQLEAIEGWYQVMPYRSGEEAAFKSANTLVSFTWDGASLSGTDLGLDESSSPADRLWRVRLPPLTPGNHSLRAVWRWNGSATQSISWVITVP